MRREARERQDPLQDTVTYLRAQGFEIAGKTEMELRQQAVLGLLTMVQENAKAAAEPVPDTSHAARVS